MLYTQNQQNGNQDNIKIEDKQADGVKPLDDHDNRIQNQGPVGLQVQEPVIKHDENVGGDQINQEIQQKVGILIPLIYHRWVQTQN